MNTCCVFYVEVDFTHIFHVSAVMSDFPSAEQWWIALGKISIPLYPLHVYPYLCPIPFAEHEKSVSLSLSVWPTYYFCLFPDSHIASHSGFLRTAAVLQAPFFD